MKLPNGLYDILKFVATITLPALATLVGTVGIAIHCQYTEIAVVVITATATFIGANLKISSNNFNKENA